MVFFFTCKFCGKTIQETDTTCKRKYISFNHDNAIGHLGWGSAEPPDDLAESPVRIEFNKCPSCKQTSFEAHGINEFMNGITLSYPESESSMVEFANIIPKAIMGDYIEAFTIKQLSPKASATLARRCLQAMIHDFWGIRQKNLNAEITELKTRLPLEQWEAIDGLRKIGNIGAHMSGDANAIVDIDEDEAEKLLRLIEFLMKDWYVQRFERNKLFTEIKEIAEEKDRQL